MKMYLISDNTDTYTGFKLIGVDGVVVHTRDEVIETVEKALSASEYGIILITEKLRTLASDYINNKMNTLGEPLFLEIPDRHGSSAHSAMTDFISSSIGIKV